MEIKHDYYLNQLIERENNGLIKIITGLKRAGKSFLLFKLFNHLLNSGISADHIIEIALDGMQYKALRDPKLCYQYIIDKIIDEDTYYILLGEVQFMPGFEDLLNGLLHLANVDIYVTGSNSKFLFSDVVTEFRGRGDEVRVYPLSFAEYYSISNLDYDDAWEDYMNYGGLPQFVFLKNDQQKSNYLKQIFNNVYIKDVIERNHLMKSHELTPLVNILASSVGSPTTPSKISNTFASTLQLSYNSKTIALRIDYLCESFLIDKAYRYDIKGRKYISTNVKYYFTYLGIRNACLHFQQIEPTHIMENIVYNKLMRRGYNVDVGTLDIYDKNSDDKTIRKHLKVDFIINKASLHYYIQVAYALASNDKIDQKFKSFAISMIH